MGVKYLAGGIGGWPKILKLTEIKFGGYIYGQIL